MKPTDLLALLFLLIPSATHAAPRATPQRCSAALNAAAFALVDGRMPADRAVRLRSDSAVLVYLTLLAREGQLMHANFGVDDEAHPMIAAMHFLVQGLNRADVGDPAWLRAFYNRFGQFAYFAAALGQQAGIVKSLEPALRAEFGRSLRRITAGRLAGFSLRQDFELQSFLDRVNNGDIAAVHQLVLYGEGPYGELLKRVRTLRDKRGVGVSSLLGVLGMYLAVQGRSVEPLLNEFTSKVPKEVARYVRRNGLKADPCRYLPAPYLLSMTDLGARPSYHRKGWNPSILKLIQPARGRE